MKSYCNTTIHNRKRKDDGRKWRRTAYWLIITNLLIAVVIVSAIPYVTETEGFFSLKIQSEAQAAVTPVTTANEVTFPVSAFSDGKAQFFEYKTSEGKTIKYFVIKSSDGVIHAAFDACNVCYQAGKGYKQDGEFMVCKNCGRPFQVTKLNAVTGGCNPASLTHSVKDGKGVISVQALNEGKRFFK